MKTLLILACTLTTLPSFAFTTVTLKKEITLSSERSPILVKDLMASKGGNDYCHIIFSSKNNADTQVVPVGTKFEVNQSDIRNVCKNNSAKKRCVLSFTARNHEQNVELDLICRDAGMFPRTLSIDKINEIAKGTVSVR